MEVAVNKKIAKHVLYVTPIFILKELIELRREECERMRR